MVLHSPYEYDLRTQVNNTLRDPVFWDSEYMPKIKVASTQPTQRVYTLDNIRDTAAVRDNITNKYIARNRIYDSITGDVIPSMSSQEREQSNRTIAEAKADKIWGKRPPEMKLKIYSLAEEPITKAEYIEMYSTRYNRAIIKGQIFHKMIHYHFVKDPNVQAEINNLMREGGITEGELEWVNANVINKLIHRTGTDYVTISYKDGDVKYIRNPDAKDKIRTELTITSDILGMAGTIDMAIDHGDSIYSYFDIKTGKGFNKLWESDMFMYGTVPSEDDVFMNPRNKAKMQLMWYAVMTKINNPKVKFRNLELIHIPNYNLIDTVDFRSRINVVDYIYMIENFLKDKHPEKYAELQKLEHFAEIFNPITYNIVTKDDVSIDDVNSDPAKELQLKMLKLQQLVLWDKNIESGVLKGYKRSRKNYEKIQKLVEEIAVMRGNPEINYAAWSTDMSWMDTWLGSPSSSTNPYVSLYYKILQEQKQAATNKYSKWRTKFSALIKKLAHEEGISDIAFGAGAIIGGASKEKLFSWMIKTEAVGEVTKHRFITEADPEYATLANTPARKQLLTFVLDSVEMFFEDSKSDYIDPRTGKQKAMANMVATIRKMGGQDKSITNIELAKMSGKMTSDVFEDNGGKFYRGFMPKYPPQTEDIIREHGVMSKEFVALLKNKYLTNYYEAFYEGWFSTEEAIPMKYLGGGEIDMNNNYTLDVELMMDNFVKQYYYKQEMDQVYTYGIAMKMYLTAKERKDDSITFEKTAQWFEDSVNQHVLGRRADTLTLTRREIRRKDIDNFKRFDVVKFLRSLKNFFAGPTMWLKPLSGLANATFAYLTSLKEAVKNEFGIQGEHVKFGMGHLREGFAEARKLFMADAMSGSWSENKAFQLMEQFRYLPDTYDWFTMPNQLLTARNKLFTTKTMYMFHSLPEEMIATAIFVAQLKAMKTPDGTSVWDHYVPVVKKDSDGFEYTNYEWDGTTRGTMNVSNIEGLPAYKELKGLEVEEINSIKFVYEKMHGGYRLDERTRAEYYIWGELMMQFKRYFPSILKNIGASRGLRETQGYWKKEIKDGKEILRWTPQIIEGRYRLLYGMLMNFLSIRTQHFFPNGKKGTGLLSWLHIQNNEAYGWDKLSEVQKDDMRDFLITSLTFISMSIGLFTMWDWDEEDSLKKLFKRIRDDFGGNIWAPEVAYNLVNLSKPVSANKAYKFATSSAETFWSGMLYITGYEEDALTTQGNLRGWKELQRNTHILASLHDLQRFFQETDDVTGPDWLEQRQK